MPRYIDADKAIDNIEETTWYHIGSLGNLVEGANSETDIPLYKAEDIHKAITETPTADVVEVVRCRDCDIPHNKWLGCPNLNGMIPPPDFYCARGEKERRRA